MVTEEDCEAMALAWLDRDRRYCVSSTGDTQPGIASSIVRFRQTLLRKCCCLESCLAACKSYSCRDMLNTLHFRIISISNPIKLL